MASDGEEEDTFLHLLQQSQVSFPDDDSATEAAFIDFDERDPDVDALAQSKTNNDAYSELINEFKHLTKVLDMCSTRDRLMKVSEFFKSQIASISGKVRREQFSSQTLSSQQEWVSSCVPGLRKKNHSGTAKMVLSRPPKSTVHGTFTM